MISYFVFGSTEKAPVDSKQASNVSSLMLTSSNRTGLLSTSNITLPYQCGAQFADKEFVRNITNAVEPKLVRHSVEHNGNISLRCPSGLHSLLHLHRLRGDQYHSDCYSTRSTASEN
jgi:hypothetical protein